MRPTHLHFDCYSGISGDMTLGALIDLGVSAQELQARLSGLAIGPFALRAERLQRQGIMGTRVHVEVSEDERTRHPDAHENPHEYEPEHGHSHGHEHAHDHPHEHEHEHDHPHPHPHPHEHAHSHHHHEHEHGPEHHSHPHEHGHEHPHEHAHAHEHPAPHAAHAHGHHDHVRLGDILTLLEGAALPPRAAARAARAYRKLAEAEATVHGSTPEQIHFHEVGAKDAVVDVAASMLGLELLGIESFSVSPVTVGFGTVRCHHGVMPVPAPATAELLKGLAQVPGPIQSEMVTPTGAAILATLLEENARPAQAERTVERLGYGAGGRDFPGHPNFLRLSLCRLAAPALDLPVREHTVAVLETEIDDMSPEIAGHLMDQLLADGAYDVQFSPVQMKKNRPALRLRVLCEPALEARLAERLFRETSTFGIRRQTLARWCLDRRMESVETPLGAVAVKLGLWGERVLKATLEYEDCRRLAQAAGQPLAEVYAQAQQAIRRRWFE